MRKLIGVHRRKLPTSETLQPSSPDATRRHRADDDAKALTPGSGGSYLAHVSPRTPNGPTDLLSGDDEEGGPTPNPARLVLREEDYEEEDDASLFPPPSHLWTNDAFDENEEMNQNKGEDDDDNIYAQLHAFEESMESELLDLEQFGVSASAPPDPETSSSSSSDKSTRAKEKKNKKSKKKRIDPDGEGGRPPSTIFARATSAASSAASSATSMFASATLQKGRGKSGKHLTKLSGRTASIMSDYQAYLAEIQEAFPLDDDDDDDANDVDVGDDPALETVRRAREDVRESYLAAEEGRRHDPDGSNGGDVPLIPPTADRNDSYATGGGEPLYRAWSTPREAPASNPGHDFAGYDVASVFGEQVRPMKRGVGQSYIALPWIRSKRARRGIAGACVLLVLVVIVSTSISNSHSKRIEESLPDWEGELVAEIKEEESEKEEGPEEELMEKLAKEDAILLSLGVVNDHDKKQEENKDLPDMIDEDTVVDKNEGVEKAEEQERHKIFHDKKQEEDLPARIDLPINKDLPALLDHPAKEDLPVHESLPSHEDLPKDEALPGSEQEYLDAMEEEKAEKKEDWAKNLEYFLGHKILSGTPLPPPPSEDDETVHDPYDFAARRYRPIMYDRSKGWKGQSYVDALVFCEEEAGLAVCPYDAICPGGTEGEPLGGYRDAPRGDWAWIPILDGHNQWVQAGARERCVRYDQMHNGEDPDWGLSGEENEDITQNVMCCIVHSV